jgi:hypothetical protein
MNPSTSIPTNQKPTKEEVAKELAKKHYEVEDGLTHIFRVRISGEAENLPGEPIKLLEVNTMSIPSGIMPLQFSARPDRGIPFSSIIIEVTPDEFEQIQRKELQLPNDWVVDEELPKLMDLNGTH